MLFKKDWDFKGELLSNGGYDIVSKNYRRDMGPVLSVLSKRKFAVAEPFIQSSSY